MGSGASLTASGHGASSTLGSAMPCQDENASKRVLLLTNSEHGQANVFLAVCDALLNSDQHVQVHLASFPPIEKFVETTSDFAQRTCQPGRRVRFHKISGIDMQSAWSRPEVGVGQPHAGPQRRAALIDNVHLLLRVTLPWTGPEFLEIFQSIVGVIREVVPDVIAVDPAFAPALTACKHLGLRFLLLTPNTIKDFAMPWQPNGESLWRYPCTGSGIPFPVPWFLVPLNCFLVLVAVTIGIQNPVKKKLSQYVREQTGGIEVVTLNDLSLNHRLDIKTIVANLPELEYPLRVIPKHLIPVGPIIRPAKSVAEADPAMARWLDRGPTIYINLGTHVLMTEDAAFEMALALRATLDEANSRLEDGRKGKSGNMQVLWKLVRDTQNGGYTVHAPQSRLRGILGQYMDRDMVRIVEWVDAEPTAILQHENVVLSVHHGGANSFLETVSAGKPHVVLPCWIDTFDFANRAELAGIGLWGNKHGHPRFRASELGPVLREMLLGPKAARFRRRAEETARLCRDNGGGKAQAARIILDEINARDGDGRTLTC